MDIVTRLRQFMEYRKIPITQFADTCNIPRPTLSQLLNGRNKKVSDELIGKIHDAYPSLSVLWLMFGEGDMLTDANTTSSEPQNGTSITFSEVENPMSQGDSTPNLFSESVTEKSSDNFTVENTPRQGSFIDLAGITAAQGVPERSGKTATISFGNEVNAAANDNGRRVVNIMVFYSDNSFESFVPSSTR